MTSLDSGQSFRSSRGEPAEQDIRQPQRPLSQGLALPNRGPQAQTLPNGSGQLPRPATVMGGQPMPGRVGGQVTRPMPAGLLRPSMYRHPVVNPEQRDTSTGEEIRSSYDAPSFGRGIRTGGGDWLNAQQGYEGPAQSSASKFRNTLKIAEPMGLKPILEEKVVEPGYNDERIYQAEETGNEWSDWLSQLRGGDQQPQQQPLTADENQGSEYSTTTSALSGNVSAGDDEQERTADIPYQDDSSPFGELDQVHATTDEEGNLIDPVTGRRLDGSEPLDEYPGQVNYEQHSEEDREWAEYLRKNGYSVVSERSDNNPEGAWYIRGGSGGRGESGTWQGQWSDPSDWSEGIQSLRKTYDAERKEETDRKDAEERSRKVHEMFDLLGEAPQMDEAEAEALIDAQNQLSTFENARGMRAAQAGAARGRMGVGGQAGMMAEASNRLALQQGEQAEKIRYQMKMANFNAQLQAFTAQEGLLRTFIQSEQDAAARERATEELKKIIKYRAEIDVEMQAEQARAEASANRGKNIGSMIGMAGGAVGGTIFGGPAGGMAGAQGGAQGGAMLGSLFDMF